MNKKKVFPLLLTLGAVVLVFRTIRLLFFENGLHSLMLWVIILTFIEMIIDLSCIFFSLKWFFKNNGKDVIISLKLAASAAIFHAFRVLIYVLGRVGPWQDFDLKPELRANHTANMFWVIFAAVLSISGVAGVFIIRFILKKKKTQRLTVHGG